MKKRVVEFVNLSNESKWQNSVRDIVRNGILAKLINLMTFQRNPLSIKAKSQFYLLVKSRAPPILPLSLHLSLSIILAAVEQSSLLWPVEQKRLPLLSAAQAASSQSPWTLVAA